jgi:hypothetical protein
VYFTALRRGWRLGVMTAAPRPSPPPAHPTWTPSVTLHSPARAVLGSFGRRRAAAALQEVLVGEHTDEDHGPITAKLSELGIFRGLTRPVTCPFSVRCAT